MKKILHVIDSLDPVRGGPAQCVRNLTEGFSNLGYQAEVVCGDSFESDFLSTVDSRVRVHAMGPSQFGYGFCTKMHAWLGKHVEKFDRVIIHGIWQFHSYAAWSAIKGRVPYYLFTHGMLDPYFKKSHPLKHLKKWMYWNIIERRIVRDARSVLFTSEMEMECSKETFSNYSASGVVVDYGVEPPPENEEGQKSAWLAKFPEIQGKRYFVYLGRIHEKKGIDLTIRAFARCAIDNADIHLVIAGENRHSYGAGLKKLSMQLDDSISSRIHWTGMLNGDEKWGALRGAEAFVLQSHQENFGKAVAEALACGTPVLISNKVNIFKEIVDGGAGFASEDTIDGAERVMEQWLQMTKENRDGLRIRARQLFENRYNIFKNIQAIADVIFASYEIQGKTS